MTAPAGRPVPPPAPRAGPEPEPVARRLQPPGHHPGAGEDVAADAAEREPERRLRQEQQPGTVHRRGQGGGELGVGDRVRRGEVHRPGDLRAGEQEAHDRCVVRERDPAHDLRARPQTGAQPEPERRQHAGQHPAAPGHHDTGAHRDHADAGLLGLARRGLPLPDHVGQETGTGGGGLIDLPPAGIPVPADGRSRQQNGWRRARRCQRAGQCPGAPDPAGPDLFLVGGGPAPAGHVRPRQVDGGVEAVQGAGSEPAGGREGVPGDLVLAGRRPADQLDHLVAAVAQGSHQGGPDQAR